MLRRVKAVMGEPKTSTPSSSSSYMYPQGLQLKLYQAFIFSIPILFSIIIFLLFYLFYLKRRDSSLSSPPLHIFPTTQTSYPYPSSPCRLDAKGKILDKLPRILFDEDLRTRDPLCCVCLGEFELKEELLQIPYCEHVFHIDCIRNWLKSKSTCPLCRCSVIPTTKFLINPPPPLQQGSVSGSSSNIISLPAQLEDQTGASSNTNFTREWNELC